MSLTFIPEPKRDEFRLVLDAAFPYAQRNALLAFADLVAEYVLDVKSVDVDAAADVFVNTLYADCSDAIRNTAHHAFRSGAAAAQDRRR